MTEPAASNKTPSTNLDTAQPETTTIPELVRLAKIRWRIEHDYRELKHGPGLDHFEGRTFAGWHRHTTLATAAHLFITELRLTADPQAHGAA